MYGAEVWQIPTREINKILSPEMDVLWRSAETLTLEKILLPTPLRNYRRTVLNIRSLHNHRNVGDKIFEHVLVAESCSIHWPGE
jgi:hypothetical protein